jgi:hypothetical protein
LKQLNPLPRSQWFQKIISNISRRIRIHIRNGFSLQSWPWGDKLMGENEGQKSRDNVPLKKKINQRKCFLYHYHIKTF